MKLSLALMTLLAATLPIRAADKLTIEKAMQVKEPSDLQFSPDGQRVALTLQEPGGDKPAVRHIWVYDLAQRELRQWTSSAKSESMARWSPDGQTLAFLSDREDSQQIWLLSLAGGEATKLTSGKSAVDSFKWSRDGKRIAYLGGEAKTPDEEKKQKEQDDARVIDVDRKLVRAWTVDVGSKAVKRITTGPWELHEIEWLPDGKRLLAVATDKPADDRRTERLFSIALEDGRMEKVQAPAGPFSRIQVDAKGSTVAYVCSPQDGPTAQDLWTMPLDTRKPKNLTSSTDRPVLSFKWINDGGIATLFENGFHSALEVTGDKKRKLVTDDSLDRLGSSLPSSPGRRGRVCRGVLRGDAGVVRRGKGRQPFQRRVKEYRRTESRDLHVQEFRRHADRSGALPRRGSWTRRRRSL